ASQNDQPVAFDELLMQSILCHPILVFQKGERPLDSRMPRALRATLDARLRRSGDRVQGWVRVQNTGDTRWLRGGGEAGAVRLGLQLLAPSRTVVNQDFARFELPADASPG